jgi:hypothetical protein
MSDSTATTTPAEPLLGYATPAAGDRLGPHVISGRRWAALGCKLLALWFCGSAIQPAIGACVGLVAAFWDLVRGGRLWWEVVGAALGTLLLAGAPLLFAAVLWRRADRLARRMVGDDVDQAPSAGIGYEGLLSVGISITGAVVLIGVLREAADAVATMAASKRTLETWWHEPWWVHRFWNAVIGVALSLWTMFGSRGIARVIVWARTAGRHEVTAVVRTGE